MSSTVLLLSFLLAELTYAATHFGSSEISDNDYQYTCKDLVRMGKVGDGGWNVCITNLSSDSIVYSFGIDKDISFELDLIDKLELKNVYTFDPTPYAKDWIVTAQRFKRLPPGLHYNDVALAKIDGKITMYQYDGTAEYTAHFLKGAIVKDVESFRAARLKTIMHDLGHTHVDLLKIDIEGGEWAVLDDILRPPLLFSQLLVEFHHFENSHLSEVVHALNKLGYKMFSISPQHREKKLTYQEICFIYTKAKERPIAPPAITTTRPTPAPPYKPDWSISEREKNRDKTLRDMERENANPHIGPGAKKFGENFETVWDRQAKQRQQLDDKLRAMYASSVKPSNDNKNNNAPSIDAKDANFLHGAKPPSRFD